jgi:hypothetical protein
MGTVYYPYLKTWLKTAFIVSLLVTLLFLEGLSFKDHTLFHVSHFGAITAMLCVCFLVGAHLVIFIHNKKVFWSSAIVIITTVELLAIMFLDYSDIPLVSLLVVAFCFGAGISQKKSCWFTHS